MRKFDTNVQLLKYRVLKEVARLEFQGKLKENLLEIPKTIMPGPKATMRCCIYKERAIIEERVKMAMGGDKENENVIEVLPIACDECPVTRYEVSNACRGCIARRCINVCPRGAIEIKDGRAYIDQEKCVECGRCSKVCPYNAIAEKKRPCESACKIDAIKMDENKKAKIINEKCIQCGACAYQCPFGAITDKSFILDAIHMLKEAKETKKYKVYAIIAPAIASQFSYAKIGQVVTGIKRLGFHEVIETALGADMVAYKEAKELAEKGTLTSSCCPAFVSYIEKHFPDLTGYISHNLSPMAEIARYIKRTDQNAKVIFIGPCTAKKKERQKETVKDYVDCVLTFEELQALLDSQNINAEELEESPLDNASYYGRIFARSGGVAEAVKQAFIEENITGFVPRAECCDGIEQCKVALLKLSRGKLDANFIEGMACVGGCIGGAACLTHEMKDRNEVDKYGKLAKEKGIKDSISIYHLVPDEE